MPADIYLRTLLTTGQEFSSSNARTQEVITWAPKTKRLQTEMATHSECLTVFWRLSSGDGTAHIHACHAQPRMQADALNGQRSHTDGTAESLPWSHNEERHGYDGSTSRGQDFFAMPPSSYNADGKLSAHNRISRFVKQSRKSVESQLICIISSVLQCFCISYFPKHNPDTQCCP